MNEEPKVATVTNDRGRKLDYELIGENRESVEWRIDELLARYDPMGYGTRFDEPKQREDGKWIATGSRCWSCD